MKHFPDQDAAFSAEGLLQSSGFATKANVILIRWPVVLVGCALALMRARPAWFTPLLYLFALSYVASNLGLYLIGEAAFRSLRFNAGLIALDSLALLAALLANGGIEPHFYLACVLLVVICSIFENPRWVAMVALLAPLIYAGIFFQATEYNPAGFMQVVFLLTIGLYYGHFSHWVRTRRTLAARAEQRSQAKTELLNILSHELKTPLTVIGSYTQALKGSALGEINPAQEDALAKVLRQTEHLENIVNVILESASVETGAASVEREELVLSEFLDELRQHCEGVMQNSKVTLIWDYPAPMPVVRSDPGKLKIILMNLIHNAVKFTDTGEIRVSARHDRELAKMAFAVADTGIGIAPEELPFVFDKFWQVESARTKTQSGIGMGLYIVRAFTELLGGKVSVNSTVGQGAEFTVELPAG